MLETIVNIHKFRNNVLLHFAKIIHPQEHYLACQTCASFKLDQLDHEINLFSMFVGFFVVIRCHSRVLDSYTTL
jgi:hypothetical protein